MIYGDRNKSPLHNSARAVHNQIGLLDNVYVRWPISKILPLQFAFHTHILICLSSGHIAIICPCAVERDTIEGILPR